MSELLLPYIMLHNIFRYYVYGSHPLIRVLFLLFITLYYLLLFKHFRGQSSLLPYGGDLIIPENHWRWWRTSRSSNIIVEFLKNRIWRHVVVCLFSIILNVLRSDLIVLFVSLFERCWSNRGIMYPCIIVCLYATITIRR